MQSGTWTPTYAQAGVPWASTRRRPRPLLLGGTGPTLPQPEGSFLSGFWDGWQPVMGRGAASSRSKRGDALVLPPSLHASCPGQGNSEGGKGGYLEATGTGAQSTAQRSLREPHLANWRQQTPDGREGHALLEGTCPAEAGSEYLLMVQGRVVHRFRLPPAPPLGGRTVPDTGLAGRPSGFKGCSPVVRGWVWGL